VIAIKDWLERDWQVVIQHIYKEANRAADFLANLGHNFDIGVQIISTFDCNLGYSLGKTVCRLLNSVEFQ
ncbi:hypothetical protein LINPERPRIM_LOCUS28673, partial [Linum perenne]